MSNGSETRLEEFWIAFGMNGDALTGKHAQSGMFKSEEKAIEWAKDCLGRNIGIPKVAIMWASKIVERQESPVIITPTFHKEKQHTQEQPLPLPQHLED